MGGVWLRGKHHCENPELAPSPSSFPLYNFILLLQVEFYIWPGATEWAACQPSDYGVKPITGVVRGFDSCNSCQDVLQRDTGPATAHSELAATVRWACQPQARNVKCRSASEELGSLTIYHLFHISTATVIESFHFFLSSFLWIRTACVDVIVEIRPLSEPVS